MFDIDYIAVPVDCSRASKASLALARSLADPSTVVAPIHAVEPWPRYMDSVLFPYAPLGEDTPELEHELVEAAREAVNSFHSLDDGELNIAFGRAPETVFRQVSQTPAQLVVVGAAGESGARPGLLGSVADRLLHSSGQPVLLARGTESSPRISKVLVALDLSEGSQAIFEAGSRVALRAGASLEVLHVVADPQVDDHANLLANILKFDRRKVAQQAKPRVEAHLDRIYRAVNMAYSEASDVTEMTRKRRVMVGDAPHAIMAHAEEIGADLIVVGSHRPGRDIGLGRVAGTVARRAPSHVLVIPTGHSTRLTDD